MSNPTQPPHDSGSGERAVRDALAELVALKDLKDQCDADIAFPEEHADYARRKPLAWAAARAALATPSQAVASALQALPACRVVDRGFRWDGVALHHVPNLLIEFEPVPMGHPIDAKGWADRDALAELLAAAPAHPVVQPGIQGDGHQAGASLPERATLGESNCHGCGRPQKSAPGGRLFADRRTWGILCGYCLGACDVSTEEARLDDAAVRESFGEDEAPTSLYRRLSDGTYREATYGEIAEAHKALGTWPFGDAGEAP